MIYFMAKGNTFLSFDIILFNSEVWRPSKTADLCLTFLCIFFFMFLVYIRNTKQDGNKFIILKIPVFGFFFKESIAL